MSVTMKGEELARAAAADFESFFLPDHPLAVQISVEAANHVCIRTNSQGSRIVIPHEMASDIITTPDNFFFHLLMISHEIAHLVHRHTHAGEQENADHMALEYWADFYGAKVMMSLVTHGSRLGPVLRTFFPGESIFDEALSSIGQAVGRLVETVYADDARYPAKLLRVGLTSNGVTSFLRHLYGPHDVNGIWYFGVFRRIFSSLPVKELMLITPESMEFDADPIERAKQWHRDMQGDTIAITPGFKLHLLPFLHTTFDQTEEESRMSEAIRREELQKAGYIID